MVVFAVLQVISTDDFYLAYVGILLPLCRGVSGGVSRVSMGGRTARKSTFLSNFCS